MSMLDHVVYFYEPGPSTLADDAAFPLAEALRRGDVAMVAAPCERLNELQQRLEAAGVDCREAVKCGRLEFLDAHAVLGEIMFAGRPDPEAFERIVGDALRGLLSRRGTHQAQVYGELVGVLWSDGNEAGAVELERLWNVLLADLPVGLGCGYPIKGFDHSVWSDTMEEVLAAHTHAVPENLVARSA